MSIDDVTSRFDCVFWLGDLNSRMQKDRDQLETMLGTQQDVDQSAQRTSFDDIVRHDELKKVIDEGFVKDFTLVYLWYFISQVQWSLLIPTT